MGLAYILRNQRVTLDVLFAAVTVYLPIAFSCATIYNTAFQLDFWSFRFPEWIETGSTEVLRPEMIYFSLVTLATLRYGDILSSSPFTHMLAVLAAWLVGMYISDNFLESVEWKDQPW